MTATYRKKLIEVAEYTAIPYAWPALVANSRIQSGLALFVYNGILARWTTHVPSVFQNGRDFRLGRVNSELGESHSRSEARS